MHCAGLIAKIRDDGLSTLFGQDSIGTNKYGDGGVLPNLHWLRGGIGTNKYKDGGGILHYYLAQCHLAHKYLSQVHL